MFYDADELVKFCSKRKITTEQFLLCYLSHKNKFPTLYKYVNEVRPIPDALINDLEKKGFIINMNKPGETFPDNFIVTDEMMEGIDNLVGGESDDFFDKFPTRVYLPSGESFLSRNLSREDTERTYKSLLFRCKVSHQKVMEALSEQITFGTVGMGMRKWLETEQWSRDDNQNLDVTHDI